MVTILGTTFGNRFGNSFWLFFVAQIYGGGLVAAHVFLSLAALKKQTTHRGAPIQTQQRAYQTAWRAPLFDLARRGAGFAIETFFQSSCHCLCTRARGEHALATKQCAAICETSRRGFTPERISRDGPRRADSHKTPARAHRKACATPCISGFLGT